MSLPSNPLSCGREYSPYTRRRLTLHWYEDLVNLPSNSMSSWYKLESCVGGSYTRGQRSSTTELGSSDLNFAESLYRVRSRD